jgi:hypothetical protein
LVTQEPVESNKEETAATVTTEVPTDSPFGGTDIQAEDNETDIKDAHYIKGEVIPNKQYTSPEGDSEYVSPTEETTTSQPALTTETDLTTVATLEEGDAESQDKQSGDEEQPAAQDEAEGTSVEEDQNQDQVADANESVGEKDELQEVGAQPENTVDENKNSVPMDIEAQQETTIGSTLGADEDEELFASTTVPAVVTTAQAIGNKEEENDELANRPAADEIEMQTTNEPEEHLEEEENAAKHEDTKLSSESSPQVATSDNFVELKEDQKVDDDKQAKPSTGDELAGTGDNNVEPADATNDEASINDDIQELLQAVEDAQEGNLCRSQAISFTACSSFTLDVNQTQANGT